MTEHDDDHDDDDDMRELVRHLFDPADRPPPDVVPGSGLTREDLLRQNANAGTWAEVTLPGKIIPSPETGLPIGFEPSTTELVHRDTAVFRSELTRLGLTEDDVPNIKVLDDPPERQQKP